MAGNLKISHTAKPYKHVLYDAPVENTIYTCETTTSIKIPMQFPTLESAHKP